MKTSDEGIRLIKQFEGLRLDAYLDAVGVWTIGYGHVHKGIHSGQHITEEEAEALLRQDLAKFERCVEEMISIKATQAEFDALVSFAFNLGCQALRDSTLIRKFNAGRKAEAAAQFHRWNHAGGRVLAGLTRRRELEAERFMA